MRIRQRLIGHEDICFFECFTFDSSASANTNSHLIRWSLPKVFTVLCLKEVMHSTCVWWNIGHFKKSEIWSKEINVSPNLQKRFTISHKNEMMSDHIIFVQSFTFSSSVTSLSVSGDYPRSVRQDYALDGSMHYKLTQFIQSYWQFITACPLTGMVETQMDWKHAWNST